MHGMHARMPKGFVLEERLERYAAAIEVAPQGLAGQWAWACHPIDPVDPTTSYREVRLDLGCGKGAFAARLAAMLPEVLLVCVDAEPMAVAYAAQKAVEQDLPNMVVVPARGSVVASLFAPSELHRIYINYPTPYPRVRDAHRRLVLAERLLELRRCLAPGATLCLRTDSQPLRDFALTQLDLAAYRVVSSSDDARADDHAMPVSEYEAMTRADGATVYEVVATPEGVAPERIVQTAPLSLVDYLPDDLSAMSYVPRGMEATVINLRHYRERRQRHSPMVSGTDADSVTA